MWWLELGYALWVATYPLAAPPMTRGQVPSIALLEFLGEFAEDSADQNGLDPLLLIEATALSADGEKDERR